MPIIFKDSLVYIKTLGRPNDQELETYPHVFFTYPDTWEPSLLDHELSPEDEITWSQLQDTRPFYDPLFDTQGDLNQRIIATLNTFLDLPDHNDTSTFNINSTSWHSLPTIPFPQMLPGQLYNPTLVGCPSFHSEHLQGHHQVRACCFHPRLSRETFQSQKPCLQHP